MGVEGRRGGGGLHWTATVGATRRGASSLWAMAKKTSKGGAGLSSCKSPNQPFFRLNVTVRPARQRQFFNGAHVRLFLHLRSTPPKAVQIRTYLKSF